MFVKLKLIVEEKDFKAFVRFEFDNRAGTDSFDLVDYEIEKLLIDNKLVEIDNNINRLHTLFGFSKIKKIEEMVEDFGYSLAGELMLDSYGEPEIKDQY